MSNFFQKLLDVAGKGNDNDHDNDDAADGE